MFACIWESSLILRQRGVHRSRDGHRRAGYRIYPVLGPAGTDTGYRLGRFLETEMASEMPVMDTGLSGRDAQVSAEM